MMNGCSGGNLSMTFNQAKFAKMCRTVNQSDIAQRLDITPQAVSRRLRNLDKIRLNEFLAICELIDEQPETFYEKGETE